jgi:hypothetical protein
MSSDSGGLSKLVNRTYVLNPEVCAVAGPEKVHDFGNQNLNSPGFKFVDGHRIALELFN